MKQNKDQDEAAKILIERFIVKPELLDELKERLESEDLVD